MSKSSKQTPARQSRLQRIRAGATNALEMLQKGRLAAPYRAEHDVVLTERRFSLRHYHAATPGVAAPVSDSINRATEPAGSGSVNAANASESVAGLASHPLLLVPPLMVAADVYDISPELSAVRFLVEQGVDVWLVDFGSPEDIEGGLDRTLDDHILAVSRAIDEVRERTGADVHVAGYSQGGMFVYQTAAYRQSEGMRSVITFGSPVDVRKVIPVKIHEPLADKLLDAARNTLSKPLDAIDGLPGLLTSTGFRLLSAKKEVQQIAGLFGLLPDREALVRREPRRRFLTGDGFVAWPGPALRTFIDEVIVNNRMVEGGLVVGGRTVTLADITCPVLYFIGLRDEIVRPAAVRSLTKVATNARLYESTAMAGHFGLVVGSKALGVIWPRVVEWVEWDQDDNNPLSFMAPDATSGLEASKASSAGADEGVVPTAPKRDVSMLYDLAGDVLDSLWNRLGDVSMDMAGVIDGMRWQIPRLARVAQLHDDERVNIGRMLAEQAAAIPDETFFLWQGHAYSYAQANARVNQFVHALRAAGVEPGHTVALLMDNHPDVLVTVAALNRMGAVSALLNTGVRGASLDHALTVSASSALLVDAAHLDLLGAVTEPAVRAIVVGAADDHRAADPDEMAASAGRPVFDLDRHLDPNIVEPPHDITIDGGIASEVALLMFTSGTTGLPKAARITNRRWALAALGSAAACTLTPKDTVYCALPLYHATGLLVAVGGALAGGSRLALAPKFSPATYWRDVRRYGATVTFYVGELCRYLIAAEPQADERAHHIRLMVGNGLRPDVWQAMLDRFGRFRVLEFYGSTEGNLCIANLLGDKIGSIGRPVEGTGTIELVAYDLETVAPYRDAKGMVLRCAPGQPGLLLSRIQTDHPLSRFEGYLDETSTEAKIVRDAFATGDAWFNTGDLIRCDEDGDYWFVDRIGDTFRWKGENVATDEVARVVERLPFIKLCAAYGVEIDGAEGRCGMVAVSLRSRRKFKGAALYQAAVDHLPGAAVPRFVRVVPNIEVTDSFKVMLGQLRDRGLRPHEGEQVYRWDPDAATYVPLEIADLEAAHAWLR